jgi:hypothetical protein
MWLYWKQLPKSEGRRVYEIFKVQSINEQEAFAEAKASWRHYLLSNR